MTVFKWGIHSLAFSDGSHVEIEPMSVTLLIGPNSSGKSLALRNIQQLFQRAGQPPFAVRELHIFRHGDLESFIAWLKSHYPLRRTGTSEYFSTRGANLDLGQIPNFWHDELLTQASAFLVHLLDAQARLSATTYTQTTDLYNSPPSAYVHVLQTNEPMLRTISGHIRDAFESDLIIDWVAGQQVGFRVGDEPLRDQDTDRVSERYAEALMKLPRLDQDGDGIRSFTGTLLAAFCGAHPVLLIDEPEAFLHPPQARRLGRILATTASELSRQIIVATHSSDVVQGVLDSNAKVAVCRVTRDGNANRPAVLQNDQIRSLWSKPLLRSAAAIDGLFHRGVVVCEADADVRFYEAALRRLERRGQLNRAADLFFTQGGGKGELATLAGAYMRLQTRTAVIADLDLLRNEVELAKVLAALGADLATWRGKYNSLKSALASQPPVTKLRDLVDMARQKLDDIERVGELTTSRKVELQNLLENGANWSEAKRYGIEKLLGGQLQNAHELLRDWEGVGLFVVPRGELEGWWREGPANNKSEWIIQALTKLEESNDIAEVDPFITRLCTWFGLPVDAS